MHGIRLNDGTTRFSVSNSKWKVFIMINDGNITKAEADWDGVRLYNTKTILTVVDKISKDCIAEISNLLDKESKEYKYVMELLNKEI